MTSEEAASDPIAAADRERMQENYRYLPRQTDQDGRPFRIIRMPAADSIFYTMHPGDGVYDFASTFRFRDGSTFPTGNPVTFVEANSYLNFILTDGVLLVQKFWKPGRSASIKEDDDQAVRVLQNAFPDRRIVQIDAEAVNLGGGGVQCIVYQQPAVRN